MIFDKRMFRDFDKKLLLAVAAAAIIGLIVLYSATQAKGLPFSKSYVLRQLNWMIIGSVLLIFVINIHTRGSSTWHIFYTART